MALAMISWELASGVAGAAEVLEVATDSGGADLVSLASGIEAESLHDIEWQRWVLSDWDLDHPEAYLPKASALRIDQHGVRYLDLVKN